uniref:Potassium channel domain-containing protein n=1 Tax=Zooxanthella nutricula TaxID=1333877 RepID=A0A6U9QFI1_9DINO
MAAAAAAAFGTFFRVAAHCSALMTAPGQRPARATCRTRSTSRSGAPSTVIGAVGGLIRGCSARKGRVGRSRGDATRRGARRRATMLDGSMEPRTLPGAVELAETVSAPPAVIAEIALVIATSFLSATSTLALPAAIAQAVDVGLDVVQVLWIVNFLVRWYSQDMRATWLLQSEALFDIVSFMPLLLAPYVDGIEHDVGFAILRVGRLLRVQRFLRDRCFFARLVGAESPESIKPFSMQLVRTVSSIATLVFVASEMMYQAEHGVNPQFTDLFTAFYFGLVTVTTVGFGDMAPITPEGRAVVCIAILAGGAVIPFELTRLAEAFVDERGADEARKGSLQAQAAIEPAQLRQLQSRADEQQATIDALAAHLSLRAGGAGSAGTATGADGAGAAAAPPGLLTACVAATLAAPAAAAPATAPVAAASHAMTAARVPLHASMGRPIVSRPTCTGGCDTCGAAGHRADAKFCFCCGAGLPLEAA